MKKNIIITDRQKELLNAIYNSIKNEGFPPSFDDLKEKLSIKSNQAILDHLNALEKKGLIKKGDGSARSTTITQKGYNIINQPALMPIVGISYAGSMTATFQQDLWTRLSDEVKIKQDMFLVEISGDSMIEAGIYNGDILVAQRSSEFTNRDIVVAQLFEGTTVKRFMLQNHAPTKFLKPENKEYDIILFKSDTKMQARIIGKYVNNNILPINPKTKTFIE
ncbi:MAG: LexA repressor [uncultured bacterium]|nr:MAG: LexA repressor [uncultured bacterium]